MKIGLAAAVMSIRCLPGQVALALLAVAGSASAKSASAAPGRQFNNPTLLYETPTADVLPAGALAISADMSYPLMQTSRNVNYLEANANIRFSPLRHLDFAVTAYTFADYVIDVKYQVVGGAPDRFGLAVGVYDVGFNSYVSPIGHDSANAWPDWRYGEDHSWYTRPYENLSAFVVTSIPVASFARVHFGLGRGRFVGYGNRSKYLNTDIFFKDEFHQWAVAVFGGLEVFVLPNVALVAEANSRELNSGVKASFGPVRAAVAWTKMEGLLFAKGDDRFGRLEVGLTYQFNSLFGLSEVTQPRESYFVPSMGSVPPPEPESVPTGPAPSELKFEFPPFTSTSTSPTSVRETSKS